MSVSQAKISVNKLAEYIVKKAARKRAILKDRKYPDPDFNMGAYHAEVERAVCEYIVGGCEDPQILSLAIQNLEQKTSEKIGTQRRINSNIDSLERFEGMLDEIDVSGCEVTKGGNRAQVLPIMNVHVSVRPELILRSVSAKGVSQVGAVKLHFSKTKPMDEEQAGYVSAVLQTYLRTHVLKQGELIDHKRCVVIDTASQQVYEGVKATKQRMKDVESECQNITAIWDAL